jgi:hypothetical protein
MQIQRGSRKEKTFSLLFVALNLTKSSESTERWSAGREIFNNALAVGSLCATFSFSEKFKNVVDMRTDKLARVKFETTSASTFNGFFSNFTFIRFAEENKAHPDLREKLEHLVRLESEELKDLRAYKWEAFSLSTRKHKFLFFFVGFPW